MATMTDADLGEIVVAWVEGEELSQAEVAILAAQVADWDPMDPQVDRFFWAGEIAPFLFDPREPAWGPPSEV